MAEPKQREVEKNEQKNEQRDEPIERREGRDEQIEKVEKVEKAEMETMVETFEHVEKESISSSTENTKNTKNSSHDRSKDYSKDDDSIKIESDEDGESQTEEGLVSPSSKTDSFVQPKDCEIILSAEKITMYIMNSYHSKRKYHPYSKYHT